MNQFPYFRFWCQRVLPLVYDGSLSIYELLCKLVDYFNNLIKDFNGIITEFDTIQKQFNELKSLIENYFENLDVQNEINIKLDEMAKDGTLENLLNSLLINQRSNITISVKFQHVHDTVCQGGCYIGNDIIVYYVNLNNNYGDLIAFNMKTGLLQWTHNLQLFHANSLSYYQNYIYSADCFSYDNPQQLLNTISVVDINNLGAVKEKIQLNTTVYSCAVDKITGKGYVIPFRGSTPNEANIVNIYSDTFKTFEKTIYLQKFPSIVYDASSQHLIVVNGFIYLLVYAPFNAVYKWDLLGNFITFYSIPSIIENKYRITESEFITYDFDNNDFYLGFFSSCDGNLVTRIAKLGLLKYVENFQPVTPIRKYFKIKPFSENFIADYFTFNSVADACNYCRTLNIIGELELDENSPSKHISVDGLKGRIIGGMKPLDFVDFYNSQCIATNINVTGKSYFQTGGENIYYSISLTASNVNIASSKITGEITGLNAYYLLQYNSNLIYQPLTGYDITVPQVIAMDYSTANPVNIGYASTVPTIATSPRLSYEQGLIYSANLTFGQTNTGKILYDFGDANFALCCLTNYGWTVCRIFIPTPSHSSIAFHANLNDSNQLIFASYEIAIDSNGNITISNLHKYNSDFSINDSGTVQFRLIGLKN